MGKKINSDVEILDIIDKILDIDWWDNNSTRINDLSYYDAYLMVYDEKITIRKNILNAYRLKDLSDKRVKKGDLPVRTIIFKTEEETKRHDEDLENFRDSLIRKIKIDKLLKS